MLGNISKLGESRWVWTAAMVAAHVLLRAGWAHQVFTGPLPYALHAHALLQDFHSDNNHAFLDTLLTDQMVFCALYQLITCNIWQGIKNIDGALQQWCGGFFFSFLISVAFKWRRHIIKKYCQGCDVSKLADDTIAASCEGQTTLRQMHASKKSGSSSQLHLPTMRLPACIPVWWHLQDLTVGLWSAGQLRQAARYCLERYRVVVPMQEMSLIPIKATSS